MLLGIGLDYLSFNRRSGTLSGGESQRIRLSTQIGSGLMGMLYVLDEPSIGLHPKDNVKMIATLESLRDIGNTVIVVEHDEDTIRAADHIVEMGPGPGVHGGEVVVQGTSATCWRARPRRPGSSSRASGPSQRPNSAARATARSLTVRGARENNLKSVDVAFPLGTLVAITGASGSGKSTLINEILYKALWKRLVDTRTLPGEHDGVDGVEHVHKVVNIDQSPIGRNSRSNPATYIGFYDNIRDLFTRSAAVGGARVQGGPVQLQRQGRPMRGVPGRGRDHHAALLHAGRGGDLRRMQGRALQQRDARRNGARQDHRRCAQHVCGGRRAVFCQRAAIGKKIEVLSDLGLGYLTLGQSATTLSGGEAQRIKIATELSKLQRSKHTVYILDEPTTGLHLADVERLLESLNRLVDAGHTVLLIEHHLDVIKTADHVIDLGPEGGHAGGRVVVTGTPEDIAACKASHTGRFLKTRLTGR